MTIEPINPGPLVMSEKWQDTITALDLVGGATDAPDHGYIADMDSSRPDWSGYAAWMVRASNNHKALVDALTNVIELWGPLANKPGDVVVEARAVLSQVDK